MSIQVLSGQPLVIATATLPQAEEGKEWSTTPQDISAPWKNAQWTLSPGFIAFFLHPPNP